MLPFEDKIPITIQTTDGDISIYDISIGDNVYGYDGNTLYEVIDIDDSKNEDIYEIVYMDGRISYHTRSELIYIGNHIINIDAIYMQKIESLRDSPLVKTKLGDIHQFPIKYSEYDLDHTIFPDPYIAGALLIYGDTSDKYINLPLNSIGVNNLFAHKYNLNYGSKLGNDKVYFRFDGKDDGELIKWSEFFPNHNTNTFSDLIIPFDYRRDTILNRKQLIRGIFDVGYNPEYFPNSCSIYHTDRNKLKIVQKVLWSLGILSNIKYDPTIINYKKIVYRLDIISHYDMHPDFFYHIGFKEDMITNNRYDDQSVYIHSIKKFGHGYSRNLILNMRQRLYLTDNFLPRLSI